MWNGRWILLIIVVSEFCCTSLWFASNSVMADLVRTFGIAHQSVGHFTSAVQLGFISGTLLFALLSIADRFSPSRVFFVCALLGAVSNLAMLIKGNLFISLLFSRFVTGFSLAGIYPVGMKIAADYYQKGLGKSLGFLVGALVLGTAFPHLLKGFTINLSWKLVLVAVSALAVLGGALIYFLVPDGPFRKQGQSVRLVAISSVFKNRQFRSAAFGYFGHMWELYAFWAFVPILLASYKTMHPQASFNIPLLSFVIIGLGGPACVAVGYIAQLAGARKTASTALFLSGVCCLFSPLAFYINNPAFFIVFLLFWGMVVIADSPLFSTLVAQHAPAAQRGSAITIVNCIGFSITIVSIQLLQILHSSASPQFIYVFLAIGPLMGLYTLRNYQKK
jgi:predicted MFS family arabinose efflux permease